MFAKEIVNYKDNLYIVKRKFQDHKDFPIKEAKEVYMCDTALRKNGILYLCQLIEEAEIIEETKNNERKKD